MLKNVIPDLDCKCRGTGDFNGGFCNCITEQLDYVTEFLVISAINYLSDKNDGKRELEINLGLSDLYLTVCQDGKQVTEVQLDFDNVVKLHNYLSDWIVKNRVNRDE